MLVTHIPESHIAFLKGADDWIVAGDYLFVHAGIRPGDAIEEQRTSDLRWIRREFTDFEGSHGMMVVHGHTITEDVEERVNRIGIDTGAYASGKLTALGLEGGHAAPLSSDRTSRGGFHHRRGRLRHQR